MKNFFDSFENQISHIIDLFNHSFFIVQQDFNIACDCVDFNTKDPDPNCKKCLGTGNKIKIKKIFGVRQDTTVPSTLRPSNSFFVAKNYYTNEQQIKIKKDNIIVDGDEILYVYQIQNHNSYKGKRVFQKSLAVTKKINSDVFLENFNSIIGRNK